MDSSSQYGRLFGKYPGIVRTVDNVTRQVRVEIPRITDGGDVLPIAEIMYPIGDRSKIEVGKVATEIEILAGDLIWVEFMGGDPRYPIIVGFRNPNQGNSTAWRRWHHANIEAIAGAVMLNTAGEKILLTVGGSSIEITASGILLTVGGSSIEITASGIKLTAPRIDLN